jgi:hypothetical protein
MYKAILKPMQTYGIQLWGTASTSNIKILEHFQSTALRMIVYVPRYVPNTVIQRDPHQQLKQNSATKALNTVLASVYTQKPSSEPHGTTRQITGHCEGTIQMTYLLDS